MFSYLKKQCTAYKKRGFTLIELIVVMSIIGVLVLLAAPKFIGQTNTAKDTNIQNDVKVAEMKVSEALIDGLDVWESWTDDGVTSDTLKAFIREDGTTLYGRGGPVYDEDDVEDGGYRVLPGTFIEQEIRSRLEGTFYANQNGTVYYESGVVRQGEADKKESGYSDEEIQLIKEGYIPIATAAELDNIRNAGGLGEKYVQVANIDLSEYSKEEEGWTPIGNYNSKFTGSFDGNGYKITGLTINRPETNYVGLFGYTEGAIIENVVLEDINVTGKSSVGGLAGGAKGATIINSYATGSVEATYQHSYVGGLVGNANGGTKISNSYSTGSVTGEYNVGGLVGWAGESTIENSYSTGSVTGDRYVGGLVGYTYDSSIKNSYTTGSVKGSRYVGGLAGSARGSTTISNSYATGKVTDRLVISSAGGLVGDEANSTAKVNNSYWDRETTGQPSSAGGGTGKSTNEMKKKDTYSGWDFDTVWKIDEGNDYPKLR